MTPEASFGNQANHDLFTCPPLDTSGLFTPLQHHHFPTYSTAMEYLPRDMSSDHMTAPSQWQSIVGLDRAPLTKEKGHEQPL